MIIRYAPEDGDEQRFDTRRLLTSEATAAARTLGVRWPELRAGLAQDDPEAMRSVVFVMLKRDDPGLRIGDFDPGVEELSTLWDAREIADRLDEAAGVDAPEDERAAFHRVLVRNSADPDATEALIEEYVAGGGPKGAAVSETGTSPTSEPSTSDSSPSASVGRRRKSTD